MGFNPASEPKAAEADPGPCRELPGAGPSARSDREPHRECRGRRCGGVQRGCADPRVELVFRCLHAWTLKDRSHASQPVGDYPQVPRRFRVSREVRGPLDTTASGSSKRPRSGFPWAVSRGDAAQRSESACPRTCSCGSHAPSLSDSSTDVERFRGISPKRIRVFPVSARKSDGET